MKDLLNYNSKKVVVTGAASGMGEATAKILIDQGAVVYALDINEPKYEVHRFIQVNLGDKTSIEHAVQQLPDTIDSIFSIAGVPGVVGKLTPIDVLTINFIGARHLIESLIPRMPEGSSIATISSLGGMGWAEKKDTILPFVTSKSFEDAQSWFKAHEKDETVLSQDATQNGSYTLSKEALILWTKYRSYNLAEKKIRLNTVSPATTETPMVKSFNDIAKADITSSFLSKVGRYAVAEDQANALVLINSDLATYISGQDLQVDYAVTSKLLFGFE